MFGRLPAQIFAGTMPILSEMYGGFPVCMLKNVLNFQYRPMYRGADKSLVRTGRKQANFSVRMA